ncbi:trimethylamine methyltransferase family protein [Lactonifactor longoviformis]|uniref:Trimethylamine---corrinoid protein Co-methyltransferase n=1 Tax=Lactonifactor longoviformis DSM 17459 TaxID=1122155 RepID=A0A1M4YZ22_9CLOT|nr:trimethylamine methyltransferase family protein [Lactonifactor longoviformis]SHF10566.1 trimethylamine---corrinoid protein Co-methyltransferase [Lactonifactor longoviformis DSM 17459]
MKRNPSNQKKDSINQTVQFQVLNEIQCIKMADAAFHILEHTGCCMKNERAREILKAHGCSVEGERVKIPETLVHKCLKTIPREIAIYDREGNPAMVLGSHTGNSYFVPGMCNFYRIDVETGERRPAVKKDTFDTGLLVEALPNIDMACGLTLISDCEPELAAAYEARELLEATAKPVLLMTTNLLEIETTYRLCCEVAGGEENFRKKPFAVAGASATSPLTHNAENVETLLFMFEKGIPTPYIAAPMTGATAPVTLAGAVALGIADNLVGMVLSQLVNPGCPLMGSCFIDMMDMQTTSFAMTAPELSLGGAASADIYRYLGIPCVCHMGMTDSCVFDQQAAMDVTAQLYTAMLSGANLNFFSGFLETAMSGSLEVLYFANDLVEYLNHIIGGMEISEETLALDVIDEVGPEGNFLSEEHTLEHYQENWKPGTLARQNWASFTENGSKDYKERANEAVKKILSGGVRRPLAQETRKRLDEIMAKASETLHRQK